MRLLATLVGLCAAVAIATPQISLSRMDPDEPLSQPTDAPTRPLNQHDTSNEDPAVLFHQLKATTPDSGIMELGEDGVARSYDQDGKVLDALRLTNSQLTSLLSEATSSDPAVLTWYRSLFTGISGYDVPSSHLFNPHPSLLPARFQPKNNNNNNNKAPPTTTSSSNNHALSMHTPSPTFCYDYVCANNFDCDLRNCGKCVDIEMFGQPVGGGRCNRNAFVDQPYMPGESSETCWWDWFFGC